MKKIDHGTGKTVEVDCITISHSPSKTSVVQYLAKSINLSLNKSGKTFNQFMLSGHIN